MLDAAPMPRTIAAESDTPPILPLTAEGLVFEAGGARLIDGVDLTLTHGPKTVILGPNGAGKSLLLRLLHGLIEPTSGAVLWNGRRPDRTVRLRQAMVFQRPVLLRRSAAANLRHALRTRGFAGEALEERLRDWLGHAGLDEVADRPARLLSGGEQQRLAMARALSLGPEVLMLDEPTASLDPASTHAIEGLIQNAQDAGTKIVLVTHDLGQARRLAEEIVFLHHGRIAERRSAVSFFKKPESDAAQAFVEGRIVL